MRVLSGHSLFLERLKLLLPTQARKDEGPIVVLCHKAGVNELLHQACGCVAFLAVLLHHLYLKLHSIIVFKLSSLSLLFTKSSFLLILDLLLGASSLATYLKEVC